jgi:hypothetical protein
MKSLLFKPKKKILLLSLLLIINDSFFANNLSNAETTSYSYPSEVINSPQKEINESYREFDTNLDQLIENIEKLSKKQIPAKQIKVDAQLVSLEQLRKTINDVKPADQSSSVEDELKKMLRVITGIEERLNVLQESGITEASLYKIQKLQGIKGIKSSEEKIAYLLEFLQKENNQLQKSLDQINQNFNWSFLQLINILLGVLIFALILLLAYSRFNQFSETKKIDNNDNNLNNLILLSEEINKIKNEQTSDKLSSNDPEETKEILQLENSNLINLLNLIEENIQKLIKENIQKEIKEIEVIAEQSPENIKILSKDIFIPMYEDLVNLYNRNGHIEGYESTRLSQILNNVTRSSPRFEPANNGLYLMVKIKTDYYLIPISDSKLVVNQYNKKTFEDVFICFPTDREWLSSKRFKLLKPALVLRDGDRWQLKEKGVIQFE